jgi:hypothetical protein
MIAIFVCIYFDGVLTAQHSKEDRQMKVLMRSLGHEVLLAHGDSTSRILPVQHEGDQYIIRFDTEFQLISSSLIAVVDEAVKRHDITTHYLVEMEQCDTKEIIYSYQVNGSVDLAAIPCGSREQPTACYNLLFSMIADDHHAQVGLAYIPDVTDGPSPPSSEARSDFSMFSLALPIFFLLAMGAFFYRRRPLTHSHILSIGAYQFDTHQMILSRAGEDIVLTSKESDLLAYLLSCANTTIKRDDILHKVWGDKGDYIGRTLDVFISKLRKKLEGDPSVKITNIKGIGYRLVLS